MVVVFADRNAYVRHARPEVGDNVEQIVGYYHLRTNRVTMYDLTAVEAWRRPGDARESPGAINRLLARPQAAEAVTTIVHEATHQIAFNTGVHRRFSDVPLWLGEGLAMYFETPDLTSQKGWRQIGAVNYPRLARLRGFAAERPADSLATLVATDDRFRDSRQGLDAYAESWGLVYFLARKYPAKFRAYLRQIAEKPYLVWDTPETRLAEFQQAFGDLATLDDEFLRYLGKVR